MNLLGSTIIEEKVIGGGCIAHARMIKLADGRNLFVKSKTSSAMFRAEAIGLAELAKAKVINVPKVLMYDQHMLVTEFVEQGVKPNGFMGDFGRRLALLHRFSGTGYGFTVDNFIGSTLQPNIAAGGEHQDWCEFYFNKRLLYQFRLAETNGFSDHYFVKLFSLIEKKLSRILAGSDNYPSLLHGDLWSGNYLVNLRGEPVLIDPAVYYGHRETDIAMTLLFGGFSQEFYNAYNEIYPLQSGWKYRINIYKLYHVLNHLNIFGRGYYAQAVELMGFYS